jgi:hypothetical protein
MAGQQLRPEDLGVTVSLDQGQLVFTAGNSYMCTLYVNSFKFFLPTRGPKCKDHASFFITLLLS